MVILIGNIYNNLFSCLSVSLSLKLHDAQHVYGPLCLLDNNNRVKLLSEPGIPGSDYINASFVSVSTSPGLQVRGWQAER